MFSLVVLLFRLLLLLLLLLLLSKVLLLLVLLLFVVDCCCYWRWCVLLLSLLLLLLPLPLGAVPLVLLRLPPLFYVQRAQQPKTIHRLSDARSRSSADKTKDKTSPNPQTHFLVSVQSNEEGCVESIDYQAATASSWNLRDDSTHPKPGRLPRNVLEFWNIVRISFGISTTLLNLGYVATATTAVFVSWRCLRGVSCQGGLWRASQHAALLPPLRTPRSRPKKNDTFLPQRALGLHTRAVVFRRPFSHKPGR